MRIASDYHDYYDTALSYGADPNLFYRRKAVEIEFGRTEASVPGWAWTPYGTPDGWRAFWRGYRYPIAAAPAAGPHWKITNIDERM